MCLADYSVGLTGPTFGSNEASPISGLAARGMIAFSLISGASALWSYGQSLSRMGGSRTCEESETSVRGGR